MTVSAIPTDLQRVEPAYRRAIGLSAAIFWIFPFAGSLVLDRLVLHELSVAGLVPILVGMIALSGIFVAPARIYRRLGYAIDERLLRVVRGWLFHTDTIVPFVRVQHIDVAQGPLDKLFGIASLVVHTAGTHNSTITLPGLSPERAASIRDSIRAEIRADAE
jgi:membrane protein YdbS with pleckstrin-like domain